MWVDGVTVQACHDIQNRDVKLDFFAIIDDLCVIIE